MVIYRSLFGQAVLGKINLGQQCHHSQNNLLPPLGDGIYLSVLQSERRLVINVSVVYPTCGHIIKTRLHVCTRRHTHPTAISYYITPRTLQLDSPAKALGFV